MLTVLNWLLGGSVAFRPVIYTLSQLVYKLWFYCLLFFKEIARNWLLPFHRNFCIFSGVFVFFLRFYKIIK